jgi:phosphoglycerate dehydrogenase-like enzyme
VARFRIFVPEPFPPAACEILADVADIVPGDAARGYGEDALVREVKDADALLITSRDRFTARVIDAAPRLRVIAKAGARPVNVDHDAARARGIAVTWTPGANSTSVAEHALLLILAVAKRLALMSARLRAGEWRDYGTFGLEVHGKTVGLIGFGSVGATLRGLLRGFDARVLVYDPLVPAAAITQAGAQPATLDEVLAASDVVSLHCELNDATRHLIDERALRRMQPGAMLINTARGAVVDEAALHRALTEGWIAGAGIDVYETEPLPAAHPLASLPNVVATPHTAAFTREAIHRETTWAAEDARALLLGKPPIHFRP